MKRHVDSYHISRPWTKESLADWFETEGSVFLTNKTEQVRARVIVASQIERAVVQNVCEYFKRKGFTPTYRPVETVSKNGRERTRSVECEILSNLEQGAS